MLVPTMSPRNDRRKTQYCATCGAAGDTVRRDQKLASAKSPRPSAAALASISAVRRRVDFLVVDASSILDIKSAVQVGRDAFWSTGQQV